MARLFSGGSLVVSYSYTCVEFRYTYINIYSRSFYLAYLYLALSELGHNVYSSVLMDSIRGSLLHTVWTSSIATLRAYAFSWMRKKEGRRQKHRARKKKDEKETRERKEWETACPRETCGCIYVKLESERGERRERERKSKNGRSNFGGGETEGETSRRSPFESGRREKKTSSHAHHCTPPHKHYT